MDWKKQAIKWRRAYWAAIDDTEENRRKIRAKSREKKAGNHSGKKRQPKQPDLFLI